MAVKESPQTASIEEDPAFAQDRFLLAPRKLTRDARYVVGAPDAEPLVFVRRVTEGASGVVAGAAGAAAGLIIFLFLNSVGDSSDVRAFHVLLAAAGLILGIAAAATIHAHLGNRGQLVLLRRDQFGEKLVQVQRIEKMAFPYVRWSVTGAKGRLLATVRINIFGRLLRSRWRVFGADGRVLAVSREDKLWRAIARRVLGLFPKRPQSDHVVTDPLGIVGYLNRTATLHGRHVLELSADMGRRLDRQVAMAVAVLIDLTER